jgi:polar amino acid transport system substrate-binding protein
MQVVSEGLKKTVKRLCKNGYQGTSKHALNVAASALVLGFACNASVAHADELSDVKASGVMRCGVLGAFEPFGFVGADRQLQGYDVDMCQAVAKRLGVKAEVKPVTIEARIPELQAGRADIMAAGLGYSPARAQQVDFSDGYYVSEHKLTVRADRGYTSLASLSGKRISFTKGGITEGFVKHSVPGAVLVGFEDTPTAFAAMVQGKADAFSVSEVVASRLVSKLGAQAGNYKIIDTPVGEETWGFGVRKNEGAMLKAVNDALVDIETSGEAQKIFDKWMGPSTIYKMKRSFKIEPIKG